MDFLKIVLSFIGGGILGIFLMGIVASGRFTDLEMEIYRLRNRLIKNKKPA